MSKTTEASTTGAALPRFRFLVLATMWLTAIFLFFDRVNISMAVPFIMKDLGLNGVQTGLILSMFSWGYIFGQLSGGVASDRLNIRNWASVFYLGWCLTTALTGLCHTVIQFAVTRTAFGFCEGAVTNPLSKLQNHWALPTERGAVNGVQLLAAYLGLMVGMPLVGWLISLYGWRAMFLVSGAVSLLGVAAFRIMVYDYPKDHPWISPRERDAITEALARDRVTFDGESGAPRKLSFNEAARTLVRNPNYWIMSAAFFFIHAIYMTNFSWLPGYLMLERGFSGMRSGIALVLPYFSAGVGAVCGGYLSDRVGSRSAVIAVASMLTIPAIAGLLFATDETVVVAMLSLMLFCNSAAVGLFVPLLFDLFPPEIIGVALALMAGLGGGLGGVLGPMVMGLSYDLTQSFTIGFTVMGAGW